MPHASQPAPTHSHDARAPLWLRTGFWVCIVISVAVVLRRIVALATPARNALPQLAALDNTFAAHAALTLTHILPALLFVLLVPFMVFRTTNRPRWIENIFYPLGAITGLTAYAMSLYSVGGWTERSAVLFYDTLFLLSLARAYLYSSHGDKMRERRWQLRAIAILLGIATTRPVMGIFFATARLTHLSLAQFFGIAFWIGFSINVVAFELWIHSVDRRRARMPHSQIPNSPLRSAL